MRPAPRGRARIRALAQCRNTSSTVTLRTATGSLPSMARGFSSSGSVEISACPLTRKRFRQARHEEHQPHVGTFHQVHQRVHLTIARPVGQQQRLVVQYVRQRPRRITPWGGVGPPVGAGGTDDVER